MPSRRSRRALIDIADNIALAQSWCVGFSEDFGDDRKTFYAVTRALEVISEASRRLEAEIKHRHPDIEWRDVASSGNIYRHNYDGVQERIILKTVRHSLPPLLAAIEMELAQDD